MDQPIERRSRREMLFGGLAAAAGLALGRFAQPDRAAAADGDPVLQGQLNEATNETTVTATAGEFAFSGQATGATGGLRGHSADGVGVRAHSDNGYGLNGVSEFDSGVVGHANNNARAGVIGVAGLDATVPDVDFESGVVGMGETGSDFASGVWGNSNTGAGVVGSGPWGVYGTGSIGTTGDVGVGGTGVYGFVGASAAPVPTPNVGVEARAESTAQLALNVVGRAKFSRSGRTLVAAGRTYITLNLAGVTSGSLVFANLFTYRSGTWVISATPVTGKFTIRFNKALTANTYVVWLVLN